METMDIFGEPEDQEEFDKYLEWVLTAIEYPLGTTALKRIRSKLAYYVEYHSLSINYFINTTFKELVLDRLYEVFEDQQEVKEDYAATILLEGADRDIDTELDWWSNQVDKIDKTMLTIMDNTYRLYPVLKETSAFAEFNKNI